MPGFLETTGRGQPVKAFSEGYRGITDIIEAPERRREEKEERALRIGALTSQRAVSEETLARTKLERQELERRIKFESEPDNINKYIDQLGLLPEAKGAFMTHMRGYGIDEFGSGRKGDILRGTQDFFKSPLGANSLRMQANYAEQTYKNASKKYRDAIQKGEGVENLEKYKSELDRAEKEMMKWSGAYSQTVELQGNISDLQGQINSMVNSGEWNNLPATLRNELEVAKGEGDVKTFMGALRKWTELQGKPETKLYSTREEAIKSSPSIKGYTVTAELTDKGWKPHYLKEEQLTEAEKDPDAHKFSEALNNARKTEQTPLFMEKLSEAEQQRAEARLRQKTKSNYLARGGNPKKFDKFWSEPGGFALTLDKEDIVTLKEYNNPDQALSHVERAFRANMISSEVRDQAISLINQNRKKWDMWRKTP